MLYILLSLRGSYYEKFNMLKSIHHVHIMLNENDKLMFPLKIFKHLLRFFHFPLLELKLMIEKPFSVLFM